MGRQDPQTLISQGGERVAGDSLGEDGGLFMLLVN